MSPNPHQDQPCTGSPATADRDRALRRIEAFIAQIGEMSRLPAFRRRLLDTAQVDLHESGLGILHVLGRAGPLSVTELADRLGVDQSTASRQVRPLQDAGLVLRTPSPADRRASLVEVTTHGHQVRDRIARVGRGDIAWAVRDWDPRDRDTLGLLLERFSAAWTAGAVAEGLYPPTHPAMAADPGPSAPAPGPSAAAPGPPTADTPRCAPDTAIPERPPPSEQEHR